MDAGKLREALQLLRQHAGGEQEQAQAGEEGEGVRCQ